MQIRLYTWPHFESEGFWNSEVWKWPIGLAKDIIITGMKTYVKYESSKLTFMILKSRQSL